MERNVPIVRSFVSGDGDRNGKVKGNGGGHGRKNIRNVNCEVFERCLQILFSF